jgi:DNA-binding GntR family transcriptional regulator
VWPEVFVSDASLSSVYVVHCLSEVLVDEKLSTKSVADAVEEALRHRILVGEERPGSVVTEVAVAARFGVGRPTAKAAVEHLVNDGLLIRTGRRGCVVAEVGADDIADLYRSRLMIERQVHARLAELEIVPSDATLANANLRHGAESDDAELVVSADVDFHLALVRAFGSPRVQRMHAPLMAEAHVCMARVQAKQLLTAETIADEHDRILGSIAAGDVTAADRYTADHLNHARDKLLEVMHREAAEFGAAERAERQTG